MPPNTGLRHKTRAKAPGTWGHEETDAKTFAAWGIDFVKSDRASTTTTRRSSPPMARTASSGTDCSTASSAPPAGRWSTLSRAHDPSHPSHDSSHPSHDSSQGRRTGGRTGSTSSTGRLTRIRRVQPLQHHLGPFVRAFLSSTPTPTRAVCYVPLGAHADPIDPML